VFKVSSRNAATVLSGEINATIIRKPDRTPLIPPTCSADCSASATAMQIGQHRRPEMRTGQPGWWLETVEYRPATQRFQEIVLSHPEEPRRWVFRQARRRPTLECSHQRGLNRVFDILDVLRPNTSRKRCNESTVFVPKEVIDQI
jgi:hypothetical protein